MADNMNAELENAAPTIPSGNGDGVVYGLVEKKRIHRVIGSSLAMFYLLLIIVCAIAYKGLDQFKVNLNQLSVEGFPQLKSEIDDNKELSTYLLTVVALLPAESGSERQSAILATANQMEKYAEAANLRVADDDASGIATGLMRAKIMLERISGLMETRTQLEQSFFTRLDAVAQILLPMTDSQGHGEGVATAALRLWETLSVCRSHVLDGGYRITGPIRGGMLLDIADLRRALPVNAGTLHGDVDNMERILLTGPSLMAVVERMNGLNRQMDVLRRNCRGLVQNLSGKSREHYIRLIDASGQEIGNIGDRVDLFIRFLLIAGIGALLTVITTYAFFRSEVITRLEKLSTALDEAASGGDPQVDTFGTDEISDIGRSIQNYTAKLNLATQLAQDANKAKSAFLANMSHEIRTPMNAIIGFTRMTLETGLNPAQRNYLEKIDNSSRILLNIINDILDFSKIEAGKLEVEFISFDIRAVIENVATASTAKADKKGLSFRVTLDEKLPPTLLGDPVRIFQVLNNLCDNAVKFTRAGEITLSVSVGEVSDFALAVNFDIKDQGIGLTSEQAGKLFQPFTQADVSTTRLFGGTGLGLAICKSLCELMGGGIKVESEYGVGSVFTVTLPFGIGDSLDILAHEEGEGAPDLSGLRILIVEDNLVNQEIVLAVMEKTNAELEVADNGAIALTKIRDGAYDLVFMDVQMPVMDGLAATRAVRALEDAEKAKIPIIAMTAHAMSEDRRICLESGMDDYVSKPIAPNEVYDLLRKRKSEMT
jgi:signal transduction histidine kinase/CheY-like chemotaxis protein